MPLKIEKLSKRSGNNWILRDIAFEAVEGRIFGICGATGSGKTTLLNAIAGIVGPNGGSIALDDRDLTSLKARDRNICLLAEKEASGVLSIFGGSQKGSSGEKQLAAFDGTLAKAGKILLLDSPFSQMDVRLKDKCFQKVRDWVAEDERIVLFASSDFDEIVSLADQAAILAGGDIKQIGTPKDIYDNPRTVDAARISGDVNLFQARRLSSTDADLPEFQTIEGNHRILARPAPKNRLGAINQNMTLAIRPEHIPISMGASFPEDNLLRAVVKSFEFQGATSLIRCASSQKLMELPRR